ncbi:hypothetical protein F2P56_030189 [Juglans regia]|uniref:Uncharacterized protein n=1 Tax=Juglans regia TaxID=51240 RepID=A0A833TP03_JUGRE|nr:hypothetical protein F2P56_030189 [Juglans regia]
MLGAAVGRCTLVRSACCTGVGKGSPGFDLMPKSPVLSIIFGSHTIFTEQRITPWVLHLRRRLRRCLGTGVISYDDSLVHCLVIPFDSCVQIDGPVSFFS